MARVLVVDDDPDVREAVELVLSENGHQVVTAAGPDEAMHAIEVAEPDLLILDVMMEQADDGIHMAQQLRRQGFSAPIMMFTALASVTGMQYGRDDAVLPVDDFQEKPIDPQTLADKVNELLEKREG